jgi:predicted ATPase
MGEPGLGKSRLFYEFKLTVPGGCLVLEAYSVSHGKASPYLPVIELLKNYFQIQLQDDERIRQEKITGRVLTLDRGLEDTLPYLFALLSIDDPALSLQQMDPQIRQRRTFQAIKKILLRESLNQPLLLIFEDLHWIDTETQGFLDVFSESVASARILLLTNYRPEYRSEWGQKTYYTQLRLAPLEKAEAEELLTFLLGTDANLKSLKQLILEKTEGTPFFMEEVVQELIEQGVLRQEASVGWVTTHPTTALHLPTTVQGVLAARIDRLAVDEKALLQQLAVIGREFSLGLVRQVVTQPEEELYRLLASLQSKEFLYEQPAFPEVEYIFKHALTQEVAYNSVLIERRKALHERTAQALETLYIATLEEHYSALAHHYSRSGNTQKAVEYLGLAGQQAIQRSANAEAVTHLTAALELLQTLPDTDERAHQELTLQITLGVPLIATKGWAAPEAERTYARAQELCQQVGETLQLFSVLFGLWLVYLLRAELQAARALAEQMLRLAHSGQDSSLLLLAHFASGNVLGWLGELAPARQHLEQGIALYDPHSHRSLAFLYGVDPGVYCLSYAAWGLWPLGYPDQALKRGQEAISLAQEISHPHSLVFALDFTASAHLLRREERTAQERAEAVIALATEQGLPDWVAWGATQRGWALVEQGQVEEGIAQLQQGLAASRATGAELLRPWLLAALAAAYGKQGQPEEGLRVVAEALFAVHKNQVRYYEAELYRLEGELLLAQEDSRLQAVGYRGKMEEAETCFQKAIEIARRQQAKSLELRATMSLARLWQQQGKHRAARNTLAEVYNWFTEGFNTKDLQEAKALLEELNH